MKIISSKQSKLCIPYTNMQHESSTLVLSFIHSLNMIEWYTVEPLLRGHPDERPPPLERPLDNVNLNIYVLIFTSDERPPLLKGHLSDAKRVASQEGFYCIFKYPKQKLLACNLAFCKLVTSLLQACNKLKLLASNWNLVLASNWNRAQACSKLAASL